jgi:hypothetical protein
MLIAYGSSKPRLSPGRRLVAKASKLILFLFDKLSIEQIPYCLGKTPRPAVFIPCSAGGKLLWHRGLDAHAPCKLATEVVIAECGLDRGRGMNRNLTADQDQACYWRSLGNADWSAVCFALFHRNQVTQVIRTHLSQPSQPPSSANSVNVIG